MASFRGKRVTQRGGAGAGRGDDPHQVTGDNAPAHGIQRPQVPGFYNWELDPEMRDEPKTNTTDSDLSSYVAYKMSKDKE